MYAFVGFFRPIVDVRTINRAAVLVAFLMLIAAPMLEVLVPFGESRFLAHLFSIGSVLVCVLLLNYLTHTQIWLISLVLFIAVFSAGSGLLTADQLSVSLIGLVLGGMIYKVLQFASILCIIEAIQRDGLALMVRRAYIVFFCATSTMSFLYFVYAKIYGRPIADDRYIAFSDSRIDNRFGAFSVEPSAYVIFPILAFVLSYGMKHERLIKGISLVFLYYTYSNLALILLPIVLVFSKRWVLPLGIALGSATIVVSSFTDINFQRFSLSLPTLINYLAHGPAVQDNSPLMGRLHTLNDTIDSICTHPFGFGLLGYKAHLSMDGHVRSVTAPGILQLIRDVGILGFMPILVIGVTYAWTYRRHAYLWFPCLIYLIFQDSYLLASVWFFLLGSAVLDEERVQPLVSKDLPRLNGPI